MLFFSLEHHLFKGKNEKMKSPQQTSFRTILVAAVLLLTVVAQSLLPTIVSAAQITLRSLTLEANGTTGGSTPDGVVNHRFDFTVPSVGNTNIGSIKFQYCTTAAGTCTVPTGVATLSATLSATQGGASGFTVGASSPVDGAPYITRTAAAVTAGTALQYTLVGVHNPTAANSSFYVRISTYASTDRSGSAIDTGTVTASTANPIVLDGTMPESLVFCTGATVAVNCTSATSGTISFNQLFSPTDTATASSQMAASTNAGAGYIITVNGPTLTSGSNTITGMAASALGSRGTSQFGLNLKLNTTLTSTVAIGAEVTLTPNGTNLKGQAATGYDTVDNFKFVSGNTVANSYNGGPGASDSQVFTVSYIANVPGSQAAGTYTTTLTYICTPTF